MQQVSPGKMTVTDGSLFFLLGNNFEINLLFVFKLNVLEMAPWKTTFLENTKLFV